MKKMVNMYFFMREAARVLGGSDTMSVVIQRLGERESDVLRSLL